MNLFILSHESVTCSSSPAISSIAFHAQPPNLRFASLIDMGFATICPLAQRSRLRSGSCTLARVFAPRFLQTHLTVTPLRFATLHLHQVGTGLSPASCRTCTAYKKEGPPLGIGGPGRRVSIAGVVFTPARGVIHPSFPLRGRWERSAKSDKQAPSPSLATFHISSFETRPRSPLMHGSRQCRIPHRTR